MNKSGAGMLFVIVAVIASGCARDTRYLTKDRQLKDIWTATSDATYIRVVGIGVPPETFKDTTRRRGTARNAALVSARKELVATLKGVRIKGSINVAQLVEEKDQLREIVDSVVSGAEEEQVEFDKSDGCVVLLRIERSKVDQMLMETAKMESATVAPEALDEQVKLSDARIADLKAKFSAVDR